MASAAGAVKAFGDASAAGALTSPPNLPVVGVAATPSGRGYWLAVGRRRSLRLRRRRLSRPGVTPLRVDDVPAEATHDLRWRILRDGRPGALVVFPEDGRPGAFHLAVRHDEGGAIVAVASFSHEPTPYRPGRRAIRMRGMAVDWPAQGHGLGRLLLCAVVDRLQRDGFEVLWCNARDSAGGFYARLGFERVGDGFVIPESGIAHHVMVRDLSS